MMYSGLCVIPFADDIQYLIKAGWTPAVCIAGLPRPLAAAFFQKASLRVQPAQSLQTECHAVLVSGSQSDGRDPFLFLPH